VRWVGWRWGIDVVTVSAMWTMIAVEMLSVVGLGHLWTRRVRVGKRLAWTPVVMVPMVGPILYGAMFDGLVTDAR
jgi:hypothetical protein